MEKWGKTIFWSFLIIVGGFVLGYFLNWNLWGVGFGVFLIVLLMILETATEGMGKWKALGIQMGTLLVITIILGFILGRSPEDVGNLFGLIIVLGIYQVIFSHKTSEKTSKRNINILKWFFIILFLLILLLFLLVAILK